MPMGEPVRARDKRTIKRSTARTWKISPPTAGPSSRAPRPAGVSKRNRGACRNDTGVELSPAGAASGARDGARQGWERKGKPIGEARNGRWRVDRGGHDGGVSDPEAPSASSSPTPPFPGQQPIPRAPARPQRRRTRDPGGGTGRAEGALPNPQAPRSVSLHHCGSPNHHGEGRPPPHPRPRSYPGSPDRRLDGAGPGGWDRGGSPVREPEAADRSRIRRCS